ncbi:MAG: hypothetical protein E7324_01305 [Clostridiales bacterium]|nr:hypothetical protein [Clostridiales bacterium]
MNIKKIAGLMLLLLLLPLAGLAEEYTVENDALILSIDTENLALTLTHKETGHGLPGQVSTAGISSKEWKGLLGNVFALDVSSGTSTSTKRVDFTNAPYEMRLEKLENGVDAYVDFTQHCQRIRLEIRLEADGISITAPADGFEEYTIEDEAGQVVNEGTSLCGLYLLPAFGATELDTHAGYIFVPEAAGAIINFSDGEGVGTTPFAKRLYGGNVGVDNAVVNVSTSAYVNTNLSRPAEMVTMPVFGMAYTDLGLGWLGLVEKGDEAAEIKAYPGGVITKYNWTGAYFVIREEYIRQTTRSMGLRARETNGNIRDMKVRFYLLSGEDANYVGMAKKYRAILEAQGALKNADTAYRPRIEFLGAENEKFLLWDQLVIMTGIGHARDILEDARQAGMSAPLAVYRGWQTGGLSQSLGSGSVALEKALGSREELAALQQQIVQDGGVFLMEMDPVMAHTERTYNMRLDIVRSIGQTIAQVYVGGERYANFYYLTPPRSAEIMKDYAQQYRADFRGLSLATLPSTLFSYYSAGSNYTRGQTLDMYCSALESMEGMTLALQNPLAAYFPYMDIYLDMPLGTTSYSFLSAEVPFLPLVLSGHVPYYGPWNNFDSNQQRQLLKMVEYGAYPSYLITQEDVQKLAYTNSSNVFSASWDVMKDIVLAADEKIADLWAAIGDRQMKNHQLLSDEAVLVTWGDDVQVLVNYGSRPFQYEGLQVGPLDYLVMKGGKAE